VLRPNIQENNLKLSDLFFKYIKNKHLERKGVTAEMLAACLIRNGFLIQIGNDFDWTDKASSKESRKEFWKVIDSTKGNQNEKY
jgi:hypothetical protein